jgi:hypothetical protein
VAPATPPAHHGRGGRTRKYRFMITAERVNNPIDLAGTGTPHG